MEYEYGSDKSEHVSEGGERAIRFILHLVVDAVRVDAGGLCGLVVLAPPARVHEHTELLVLTRVQQIVAVIVKDEDGGARVRMRTQARLRCACVSPLSSGKHKSVCKMTEAPLSVLHQDRRRSAIAQGHSTKAAQGRDRGNEEHHVEESSYHSAQNLTLLLPMVMRSCVFPRFRQSIKQLFDADLKYEGASP